MIKPVDYFFNPKMVVILSPIRKYFQLELYASILLKRFHEPHCRAVTFLLQICAD